MLARPLPVALPARVFVVLVLLLRGGIITALLVGGGGNPARAGLHLFTNVAQCLHVVSLVLCVVGFWRARVQRFALLASLPQMVLLAGLVAVTLVLAVSDNDAIYTKHIDCWGGPHTFGFIHTRDFIVHSQVAFEMLLIWCALRRQARACTAAALCAWGARARFGYRLYVLLAGLIPFIVYCSIADIHRVYPILSSSLLIWAVIAPVGLFMGAVYWYAMLPRVREHLHGDDDCGPGAATLPRASCGACGAVVPVLRLDAACGDTALKL